MPVKNWYALRAFRFAILYVVALCAIKLFAVLATLAGTATIFDHPLRIALLAAVGIGWPTFAPQHFDWLRSLTFAGPTSGFGGLAIIWGPFAIVASASIFFGIHLALPSDIAMTWSIAGMLALTDREHPGDRTRFKREADDALRRLVASYESVYGPVSAPAPIPNYKTGALGRDFRFGPNVTMISLWIEQCSPSSAP